MATNREIGALLAGVAMVFTIAGWATRTEIKLNRVSDRLGTIQETKPLKALSLTLITRDSRSGGAVTIPLYKPIEEDATFHINDAVVVRAGQVTYCSQFAVCGAGTAGFEGIPAYQVNVREWRSGSEGQSGYVINSRMVAGPNLELTWKAHGSATGVEEINLLVVGH